MKVTWAEFVFAGMAPPCGRGLKEEVLLKTILVVDDEPLFRTSIADGLMAADSAFDVVAAENGSIAWDYLNRQPVDLLMTDLNMPVSDGFELLARMTRLPKKIPIIVITSFGGHDVESRVRANGAVHFFEKPIDLDKLIGEIRSILSIPNAKVRGLSLPGFCQLLAVERKSCRVNVSFDSGTGALCFEEGHLVHAEAGDLVGVEAAHVLFQSKGAELSVISQGRESQPTINETLNELILSSAKDADEENRVVSTLDVDRSFADLVQSETSDTVPILEESSLAETDRERPDQGELGAMSNISDSLKKCIEIEGALGVALVDFESGFCLGQAGGNQDLNLDVAAAGNTEVVRAKMKVMSALGLDESIEDILITLGTQYHLIRPLTKHQNLFLYLAISRSSGNLGMARIKLKKVEDALEV